MLEVTPDDFAARQAADRINLSLSHTREFLLAALEQKAERLACNPSCSSSISVLLEENVLADLASS